MTKQQINYNQLRSEFKDYDLSLALVFGFFTGASLAQKSPNKHPITEVELFKRIHIESMWKFKLSEQLKQIYTEIDYLLKNNIFLQFDQIFGIKYATDNLYLKYLHEFSSQVFNAYYLITNNLANASDETKDNGKMLQQLNQIIEQINHENDGLSQDELEQIEQSLNQLIHVIYQTKW